VIRPTSLKYLPGVLAAVVLSLAFTATALAEPIQFGARRVEVPAPEGYEPVAAEIPRFIESAQAYVPITNRVVEAYLTPADKAAALEGREPAMVRSFMLQSWRDSEGQIVSVAEFAEGMKPFEAQLAPFVASSSPEFDKLFEQGNEQMQRDTGKDGGLGLAEPRLLGVFRREPWGVFFTIAALAQSNVGGKVRQRLAISSCGVVLVGGQIMYLYSATDAAAPDARAWAERSVSAWADAARAANPRK
jgi:hypothetical protein